MLSARSSAGRAGGFSFFSSEGPVNSVDGRIAGFVDNDAASLHHPTHFADGHLNVGKGIAFDVGKAPPERPAFQPYRGKLAVRNDRGDRGNVGIIRSPVRASILPDLIRGISAPGTRARFFGLLFILIQRGDRLES
jgi:hypothetical protein